MFPFERTGDLRQWETSDPNGFVVEAKGKETKGFSVHLNEQNARYFRSGVEPYECEIS